MMKGFSYWVSKGHMWPTSNNQGDHEVVLASDHEAEVARLREELEGVRQINRLQAEALAEERHTNRCLSAALAGACEVAK